MRILSIITGVFGTAYSLFCFCALVLGAVWSQHPMTPEQAMLALWLLLAAALCASWAALAAHT